jgi:hypothetical protein
MSNDLNQILGNILRNMPQSVNGSIPMVVLNNIFGDENSGTFDSNGEVNEVNEETDDNTEKNKVILENMQNMIKLILPQISKTLQESTTSLTRVCESTQQIPGRSTITSVKKTDTCSLNGKSSPEQPSTPKNTPTEEFTILDGRIFESVPMAPRDNFLRSDYVRKSFQKDLRIVIETDNVEKITSVIDLQNLDFYKKENKWNIPVSTESGTIVTAFEYICMYGSRLMLLDILSNVNQCKGLPLMDCFTMACEKRKLEVVQIFMMSQKWDLLHETVFFANDTIAKQILLPLHKSASIPFVMNLPRSQLRIYLQFVNSVNSVKLI